MYLRALGAEYVVVHGKGSREYYRDFVRPERLAGLTEALRVEDDSGVRAAAAADRAHDAGRRSRAGGGEGASEAGGAVRRGDGRRIAGGARGEWEGPSSWRLRERRRGRW